MAKWYQQRQKFGFQEAASSYIRGNLLSSLNTHILNATSTGINVAFKPVEDLGKAIFDIPASILQRKAREHTFTDAGAGFTAMMTQGFRTGLRDMRDVFRHGATELQARTLDLGAREMPGGIKNPYNAIRRTAIGVDAFWKGVAFESERASQAVRRAMLEPAEKLVPEIAERLAKSEGLTGDKLAQRIAELTDSPATLRRAQMEAKPLSKEALQGRVRTLLEDDSVLDAARLAADQYTFNEAPDEATRFLLSLRRLANDWGGGIAGDLIMPFLPTLANVGKRTLKLSPLGLARLLRPQNWHGTKPAEILTEAAVGATAWFILSKALENRQVTAGAPKDPAARDLFYDSGKKPYSIYVDWIPGVKPEWRSYRGLGPPTAMIATVAATKEDYWKKGKATPTDTFWRVADEAMKAMVQTSALASLGDLWEFTQDLKGKSEEFAASKLRALVPMSSLLGSITAATDPVMRDPGRDKSGSFDAIQKNIGERFEAGIPGMSRNLPPRVNTLGEEVRRNPEGWKAMFPAVFGGKTTDDPVVKELERLRIFPEPSNRTVSEREGYRNLTPQQYGEMQKAVGTQVRKYLEREIGSKEYQRDSDADKARVLQRIVSKAGSAARRLYYYENKIRPQRVDPGKKFEQQQQRREEVGDLLEEVVR